MAKYKLEIVRIECTGCELCASTCPEHFEMAGDGLSTLKDGTKVDDNDEKEIEDLGCAQEAAESCPSTCIHVYENGKKIV